MDIEQRFNNQWTKGETTREIRIYVNSMQLKTQKCQNLWDDAITVVRQRFITIRICIAKAKISNPQPKFKF